MGGKSEVEETEAQKAQREYASSMMMDYRQRWEPLQAKLAKSVQERGAEGSTERKLAKGVASTDTQSAFQKAQQSVEKQQANTGVGLGSGRQVMAETGVAADKAEATGTAESLADQAVTNRYLEGLTALSALGRGQRAGVTKSLSADASTAANKALADAQRSSDTRAGWGKMAGTGVGAAAGSYGKGGWGGGGGETAQSGGTGLQASSNNFGQTFASEGGYSFGGA